MIFKSYLYPLTITVFFGVLLSIPQILAGVTDSTAHHVYFVSPGGDDNNAGTKGAPWKTLHKASTAKAGDTILFLPGKYAGILQPQNSGKKDAPIIFRAVNPGTVTLTGKAVDKYNYAISIKGKQYIQLSGIHVAPQNPSFGRWLRIDSTTPSKKCINDDNPGVKPNHIKVMNMVMEKSFGKGGGGTSIPFIVRNADQVQVINSTLRLFAGGDMAWFQCNSHVLYQGNSISYTGHSPTAFSPLFRFKSNNYVVVRSNVFHGGWSRPFETFGDRHVLFEDNVITHAYHGGFSAGSEAKLILDHSIFRFNRVYRNFGSPINIHYVRLEADANNTYIYNNIFADNYSDGVNISDLMKNYVFKNNVFADNDKFGGNRQLFFGGNASNSKYINNAFWGGQTKDIFNYTNKRFGLGTSYTLRDLQSTTWTSSHGDQFKDNINVKPQFVDPKNYNYVLNSGSPLIDAGQALTKAVDSGSGKIIQVEDANYFYDGYDIEGESGDLIAIGSSSEQARVVKVNRDDNKLILDRSVKWKAGDPVSLAWIGNSPDIGVYEYNSLSNSNHNIKQKGRASVQIITNPFQVSLHQPIHFQAQTHGISRPGSYNWRFSDGTEAKGKEVSHKYNKLFVELKGGAPHGYPVYLEVVDAKGHTYEAASFVELKDTSTETLVSINFNADNHPLHGEANFENNNGNWWWRIYHTRPKTDINIENNKGNGVGHFTAPKDNVSVHAEVYPAEWDIDTYPFVKFRYRLEKNIPVAIYLRAFSDSKQERYAYVAASPKAKPDVDQDKIIANNTLVNDGKWHSVTIDARAIRKQFPDVHVLQEFFIGAPDPSKIKAGDGYYLDDFQIVASSDK